MIAYIQGEILKKSPHSVVIEAGGLGYEVMVPLSTFYTLPEKNERVSLHVHTHVREDSLLLFGFRTDAEKELFTMLISISGIGPKLAIGVLSGMGPQDLLESIAAGDAVRLRAIPGVGKKTAERIVLELKEKAGRILGEKATETAVPPADIQAHTDDALSALVNLGYPLKSAKQAIEVVLQGHGVRTLEELIKGALKTLM
jgi:holliday junction DNA helicase RuvA